ncbi:hydrolase [Pacificimonas flava]|uniref:Hydrolase n=2 Tax=Pacificimonas TaxID=1960290 RepID=A0A219B878_9SPHN|nr:MULTISPECIES: amidohydrolase family protein [Pacificimonas]MBZ6378367.1 amidohydrolase family protein [Pacificimonas aurantium]OWV34326.1 hydrolase [Pacificimonas flava]
MRPKHSYGAAAFAVLSLVALAPAAAETSAPDQTVPVTIYTGVTLIDGTGAPARPNMAIRVDGDKIAAIFEDGKLGAFPETAEIVDASGLFALPGLIDSHVHLATPPNRSRAHALLRRHLYSGVTAVRDMADDLRSLGEITRETRVGEVPGPDIYYAALVAGPSFFTDPRTIAVAAGRTPGEVPWMQAIDETTDLTTAVAMARGTSATAIKIYANLPAPAVAAITAEAHRQDVPVWAHAMVFPTTPEEVIDAGVDVMSHSCYMAYQVTPRQPQSYQERFPVEEAPFADGDNPQLRALFARMGQEDIILDATNRVYAVGAERYREGETDTPPFCSETLSYSLTAQAYREGVDIAAGTDGMTAWDDPYPALFEELELLAEEVGMPPIQVIRSATLVGAMAIGEQDRMGTAEPGKLANLVFVERDPLADIGNLRSVAFTLKRGERFDRADYMPITEAEMSADPE